MQEIFRFLKEYWQLIVAVMVFIVSVIVAIIRKKPINTMMNLIFTAAIQAINVAETTELKGLDKLRYCVGLVYKHLQVNCPGINAKQYLGTIVDTIEQILSTPQKKGGN